MDDVTQFDTVKYAKSVAASSGMNESDVIVKKVDYQVKVGYGFEGDITESQAVAVIADHQNVPESAVEVTTSRRLNEFRRLETISFEAVITTEDAQAVSAIADSAADTTTLKESLKKLLESDVVPTVTVSKPPQKIVRVKTELKANVAMTETFTTALTQKLEENLGVSAKASVTDVTVGTPAPEASSSSQVADTSTAAPGTANDDDDGGPGVVIGVVGGAVGLLAIGGAATFFVRSRMAARKAEQNPEGAEVVLGRSADEGENPTNNIVADAAAEFKSNQV